MNFAKVLKISFTEHFRTTVSEFFYLFYCFLPPDDLIETSFFCIFGHVLSRLSNVMNIMNLNNLVVASWVHSVPGDIS